MKTFFEILRVRFVMPWQKVCSERKASALAKYLDFVKPGHLPSHCQCDPFHSILMSYNVLYVIYYYGKAPLVARKVQMAFKHYSQL